MNRFIVKKRTAIDGRCWWCIYDQKENHWSTIIFHGKYKRKKDAENAIKCYSFL